MVHLKAKDTVINLAIYRLQICDVMFLGLFLDLSKSEFIHYLKRLTLFCWACFYKITRKKNLSLTSTRPSSPPQPPCCFPPISLWGSDFILPLTVQVKMKDSERGTHETRAEAASLAGRTGCAVRRPRWPVWRLSSESLPMQTVKSKEGQKPNY